MAPATMVLPDVYVGAGSNIDPVENLRFACRALEQVFGELALSSVYQTAPVGLRGDDFLNMAIGFSTARSLDRIVSELERIQILAGRAPDSGKFVSRTLDLDLLLYGDQVVDGPAATLPRADVIEYAFVLQPLAELAPELRHPVTGLTIAEHWAGFDRGGQQVRRLCGLYQPTLRPPSTAIT
jgi:2-amino-4-hydroxy-6-hydroxymethyldihydropteridine diphosphokinase